MPQGNAPPIHPQRGPYAPLPKGLAPIAFGRPAGARLHLAGARVLVVEDDADLREAICVLLKMAGAEVLCVESVAEAMDGVYHSFDPDVVLTEYAMPDADGLDWRARVLEAGAADLLIKPFDPALLIARIAAAVASGRSGPH
jgi:DNA-binding response OmpR family regulator